ncbi:MAG: 2-phospho-L-lactate guanylyltransferase [Gammaproteobacteria bacterium]|nr:2-phospho-L-lactate guanylyltransferase [Gammaproteobacteria bacterium]
MWAVVPLKQLEKAKARLANVLSAEERRSLMLAMARDVLNALSRSKRLTGILLVSRTTEADALAQTFGTERFAESPTANLSGALIQASDYLITQLEAKGAMIVPADVPLITPDEIDTILAQHTAVTVVPDDENLGTNCLICSPPNCIEYVFDGRSFKPHVDAAFAKGFTPTIVPSAGFALDIDTPDDLRALLARDPASQTATYLDKSGIARRLVDADNGSLNSG